MAGVTDSAFRLLCHEQGAALVYTEMVSSMGLWHKDKKTGAILSVREGEKPAAIQLFGSNPGIMASAAAGLSGRDIALIDVNMGCPVAKVAKNGDGSALMKTPHIAAAVIEAMASKSKKPVTAKIRMGWDAEHVNAVEMAVELEAAGASAIAIHGRTREQYYGGKADWGIIAAIKAAVSIPVIGNGDVYSGADAVRMLRETGCDFVMIARGAMGNPWIFRDALLLLGGASDSDVRALAPSLAERGRTFLRQATLTAEAKGEATAVREMRKQTGWYFRGAPGVSALKGRVNHIATLDALITEITSFTS